MKDLDTIMQHSVTNGIKTVSYLKNSHGEFELVEGEGWQPVNDVNWQAWQEIEKNIECARKKVASGRASCLYYYMVANQMNILLLARYTRQSPLRVFFHLLPVCFRRLKSAEVQKYADLFHVAPEDLISGNLQPPVYNSPSHHA